MTVSTPIKLHADLSRPAEVDTTALAWTPSPSPGVERRMIERDGAEAARATSLVRYAPGSAFPTHTHPLGEEILVLEGSFGDEHGDYPVGTYLRNPPGSAHAPRTPEGCVIFVKLRHMHPRDARHVIVDTASAAWRSTATPGLELMPLGGFMGERAALLRLAPGAAPRTHRHAGGAEILVLDGVLEDAQGRHPEGSWLRLPPGTVQRARSVDGCTVFIKSGHLRGAAVSR